MDILKVVMVLILSVIVADCDSGFKAMMPRNDHFGGWTAIYKPNTDEQQEYPGYWYDESTFPSLTTQVERYPDSISTNQFNYYPTSPRPDSSQTYSTTNNVFQAIPPPNSTSPSTNQPRTSVAFDQYVNTLVQEIRNRINPAMQLEPVQTMQQINQNNMPNSPNFQSSPPNNAPNIIPIQSFNTNPVNNSGNDILINIGNQMIRIPVNPSGQVPFPIIQLLYQLNGQMSQLNSQNSQLQPNQIQSMINTIQDQILSISNNNPNPNQNQQISNNQQTFNNNNPNQIQSTLNNNNNQNPNLNQRNLITNNFIPNQNQQTLNENNPSSNQIQSTLNNIQNPNLIQRTLNTNNDNINQNQQTLNNPNQIPSTLNNNQIQQNLNNNNNNNPNPNRIQTVNNNPNQIQSNLNNNNQLQTFTTTNDQLLLRNGNSRNQQIPTLMLPPPVSSLNTQNTFNTQTINQLPTAQTISPQFPLSNTPLTDAAQQIFPPFLINPQNIPNQATTPLNSPQNPQQNLLHNRLNSYNVPIGNVPWLNSGWVKPNKKLPIINELWNRPPNSFGTPPIQNGLLRPAAPETIVKVINLSPNSKIRGGKIFRFHRSRPGNQNVFW